ncbi:hypothetical protein [uncultured Chryseobacterium sp.]|uniref:J domain-containing protein n=1 Tax=uncultured Chryseobacterium sp. TaxID=259322 RepID=UPI00261965ED|nr:hypothetical protein [uncultured Chryseobacterium sp.]
MEKPELLDALAKLKAGYISILNDLEVMKNWGKVQLEALYATKIGKFEIELLELKIELKALKKKIQLAHQEINLGKYPNFEEIDERVNEMTKEAYREIVEEKDKLAFGKAVLSNLGSPEDSMELRKIYRNIAKKLHPDINPHLSKQQKEIWQLFQNAYKNGDLDKMKALEIVYQDDLKNTENNTDELSIENILLQTAMLTQGIKELEEQKKLLESEFPFKIAEEIRDEEWVKEQQDRLQREIDEFKLAISEKNEIYELLKETYGN